MNDRITIEELRELCHSEKNIEITDHAFLRFSARKIRIDDVMCAIQDGEIIEQYPDDYPFPSCLVLGLSTTKSNLHIVCGIGKEKIWLITAYYPTTDKWENDFKTRKDEE